MPGVIATLPRFQFSNNGVPLVNGTLTTYLAGSTTLASTFKDQALTIANTNPIMLDARGEVVLWLDSVKAYKFVLANSGGVIQWTEDNVKGANGNDYTAPTGSNLMNFTPPTTGGGTRTVQTELAETVKITQFYGGSANDSTAFARAVAALSGIEGIVRLPARAAPYMLDPYMLADLGSSTNRIKIVGEGWATKLQVASACTNFITLSGAWSGLDDFLILDPNNLCSTAYILTQPATGAPSLERSIDSIRVIGPGAASTATLLVNNGGQQVMMNNTYSQNVMGHFWNKGGGVDSKLGRAYSLGTKYGMRLDGNATYGHPENLSADNWTMLCTQPGAVAYWITDALHTVLNTCVGAQLGSGGNGLFVDGITGAGSNLLNLNNCYFEGSDTGNAVRSRGNNQRMHMTNGGMGQGGYPTSAIKPIDMDGAFAFVFDGVEMFFPSGTPNKIATLANSTGTVTETCKGWGNATNPSTETACDINWETAFNEGAPLVRNTTSKYPNSDWTTFNPTPSTSGGTGTVFGAVDCAYRVQGKTCDLRISLAITTNGTGSGVVFIGVPIINKVGKTQVIQGSENGATGKAIQGVIVSNGISIKFFDGLYPGANGAVLVLTGSYEIA